MRTRRLVRAYAELEGCSTGEALEKLVELGWQSPDRKLYVFAPWIERLAAAPDELTKLPSMPPELLESLSALVQRMGENEHDPKQQPEE